jgi:uncharacterized protein YajQ (UPF0234 family)
MADEYSFDIVAEVDMTEMQNAHAIAMKQIGNRYDFKGKTCILDLNKTEKTVVAEGSDDYVVGAMMDLFTTALAKRGVDLRCLAEKAKEIAPGGNVRKRFAIRDTMEQEECKKITKAVKESKLKVRANIQGEMVRIFGKSKDDLQTAMQLVRGLSLECPVKFTNYK